MPAFSDWSSLPKNGDRYKPTFLDLFCGAGGLSLGFKRAGFEPLLALDKHQAAVDTYKLNVSPKVLVHDLEQPIELPSSDVFIGGPPCQGFSSAGLRASGDSRNTLISIFASIVSELHPRAFVFENVEGFLTTDGGNRVLDLLEPLVAVGYRIRLHKINAANYGVPQHRKRVIAIGGLGWDPSFPIPTHSAFGAPGAHLAGKHLPLALTVSQALKGLAPPTLVDPGYPVEHVYRTLQGIELERAQALKPGQRMRDLPPEFWHRSYERRAFRRVKDGTPSERRGGAPAGMLRLRADEPSKAITSGARSEFLHPTEDRYLTIRECARLQTFPDEFCFAGNLSQRTQLVGDAVPPALAYAIARNLKSDLEQARPHFARGKLLSFIPTLSSGLSPALERAVNKVSSSFLKESESSEQLSLWH